MCLDGNRGLRGGEMVMGEVREGEEDVKKVGKCAVA